MAGGVFAYLGGVWRTASYHDAWDSTAGVWRDVREIWGYSSGAWRLHYQRATIRGVGSSLINTDPTDAFLITFDINGLATPGPVSWDIVLDGIVQGSGFVAGGVGSVSYGVSGPGIAPHTGAVRIYNVRGRLIQSVPIPF